MKRFNKITSIVLAIAMVVTLITVVPATDAKAAVKFYTGRKLTITVGKKDYIIVKGKAKYTSANKKVATVSKKGTVKGKKPGVCKITVRVGKSKATSTVKVLPAKVSISSVSLSGTTATVKWKSQKNVKGYYIYRSNQKNSGYKKIATVKGAKKTSYKSTGLAAGKEYFYKIKAYATSGKTKLVSEKFSAVKSAKVWKLIWNDEFNGTKLDTKKWNNNGATGRTGYGNKELQDYQMEYSEVKNGNYIIKPQFSWNPRTKSYVNDSAYSTKIWTKGQYSVQYGKVEFRAKLPKGQGTWAAAWMLGDNYKWPRCGEIDILETTSDPLKRTIPQSIHNERFNGMPTSPGNKYKHTIINDATTAYHTYGIIWNSQTITFTIDGKVTWVYDPDNFNASGDGNGDIRIWPFNQPCYLILNCAVGGTLGGDPNPNYWTKIGTDSKGNEIYQDYYYIDWVRVYQ